MTPCDLEKIKEQIMPWSNLGNIRLVESLIAEVEALRKDNQALKTISGGEAMKVLVVTSGQYSSYQVEGVFSTLEAAQLFSDWVSSCNDPIEFELDEKPTVRPDGRLPWSVCMQSDGNCGAYRVDPRLYDEEDCNIFIHHGNRSFGVTVFADDKDHAIKIVNEKRIQLLAEGRLFQP